MCCSSHEPIWIIMWNDRLNSDLLRHFSVLVKLRIVAFYLIYISNIIWTEWNALIRGLRKNLLIQALSSSPSLFQRVMNFVCWPQICLSKVGIFPVFKQNPQFSLAFWPFFLFPDLCYQFQTGFLRLDTHTGGSLLFEEWDKMNMTMNLCCLSWNSSSFYTIFS